MSKPQGTPDRMEWQPSTQKHSQPAKATIGSDADPRMSPKIRGNGTVDAEWVSFMRSGITEPNHRPSKTMVTWQQQPMPKSPVAPTDMHFYDPSGRDHFVIYSEMKTLGLSMPHMTWLTDWATGAYHDKVPIHTALSDGMVSILLLVHVPAQLLAALWPLDFDANGEVYLSRPNRGYGLVLSEKSRVIAFRGSSNSPYLLLGSRNGGGIVQGQTFTVTNKNHDFFQRLTVRWYWPPNAIHPEISEDVTAANFAHIVDGKLRRCDEGNMRAADQSRLVQKTLTLAGHSAAGDILHNRVRNLLALAPPPRTEVEHWSKEEVQDLIKWKDESIMQLTHMSVMYKQLSSAMKPSLTSLPRTITWQGDRTGDGLARFYTKIRPVMEKEGVNGLVRVLDGDSDALNNLDSLMTN